MLNNLFSALDKHIQLILDAHNYIWSNPETGYKETKTSVYLERQFEALGYKIVRAENIPGFYTIVDTGREGPEILILGELDSVICPEHPDADDKTGAAHCCGHSAQSAALLGIAAALKQPGVLNGLSGRIRLCAVPAEELVEIDYRRQLREEGIIKYFCGKREFLYRGYFDGVDIALMVHTSQSEGFITQKGNVGCMLKRVIYKGVSAHAGGAPWDGRNALYAATQGLSAINSIRETFKESDFIRVHPIITSGGNSVNAIPDEVVLESYVRGSSFESIWEANKKVNRALCGAALSLGTNIEIIDEAGYSPLYNNDSLISVANEAAKFIPQVELNAVDSFSSGSTDMGDLSCVMPVAHIYAPGAVGISHGADYFIKDAMIACVGSAKWQLAILYLLLRHEAAKANEIVQNFNPKFGSKEEYFNYIDSVCSSGNRIVYEEDKATVKL